MRLVNRAWPMQLLILCAPVIEVLAFEENARSAGLPGQTLGEVQRRRPADILAQIIR